MYIEEEKVISKTEKELRINFGKNKLGLSDELIKIGKRVEELSKEYSVYLRDSFVDELDDVYEFTFVLFKDR
jgi:hypothetical protein